jgi:peptidoglycan L-alanyl-D-glutamate endopeptidase CwlK
MKFSNNSLSRLKGVNDKLVMLMTASIIDTPIDFCIVEGVRTLERQKILFDEKKSKTLKSKHLTGNAVDICPYINGTLVWDNNEAWTQLIEHVKKVAEQLNINIVCGYDWKWDRPHVELASR